MQKDELRRLLNQPYQQDNWKKVVDFVFPNVSYLQNPLDIPTDNKKVESFKQLGTVRMNDGKNLAMFEVHVAPNVNIARNRVDLRNLVAPLIDQERNHGVLVIYEQGKEDYRFTFTAKATEFDEDKGDFVSKETDTKRYTYVLGEHESCKTAAQRFHTLAEKKISSTIDDVLDAFSVEKVSKQFFNEYKQKYEDFVQFLTGKRQIKKNGKWEEEIKHEPHQMLNYVFKANEKNARDFIKLLLGRLVFIQFVQKKKWMGVPLLEDGWQNGDPNFLANSYKNYQHKDLFYSQFLEPLFYDTLNNGYRENDLFAPTGTKIPYLNGGLFEKGDLDTSLVNFPAKYFHELFEFFDQYNFTIDENDPEEHEVGIDPEMLGHIFENLLEDNKDKGSFYTPKEIVHYMCQESLIEYLKTYLQGKQLWPDDEALAKELEENTRSFVTKKEAGGVIDFDKALATALRDVKICDPAIGSGAFPMGLLNEIYRCVHMLYDASPDIVGDVWGMNEWRANVVKANIIQNSIYGVDIEKGAVDIARLRFWLSLIIDEPEPTALPNLDYKIMQGNSLLESYKDIDLCVTVTEETKLFEDENKFSSHDIKNLKDLVSDYFNADSKLKNELQKRIEDIVNKFITDILTDKTKRNNELLEITQKKISIAKSQHPKNNSEIAKKEKALIKLNNELNKYIKEADKLSKTIAELIEIQKTKINPYFLWHLWYSDVFENGGFDIVIANPPYVESKKLKYIALYLKKYSVYAGTADLSSYFFERGIQLCKELGHLCFINTNKFFNTGYGRPLRKYLLDFEIKKIINFEQVEVFENILVSSVILGLQKVDTNQFNFGYKKFFKLKNKDFVNKFISEIQNIESYSQNDLTDDEWSFANRTSLSIKSKIDSKGKALKLIEGVAIYRGVTTGYNPAFIILDEKRKELIQKDEKNQDLIKSLLQGRNIRKWIYNESEENLIFTKQGIDIEKYPQIKDYLYLFYSELKPRKEDEEEGRKPGDYKWFEIQDNTAYYREFEKNEKIIWGLTADKWAFAYDDKQHYLPSNGYILTSEKLSVKYILSLLNSNLLKYYFGFIGIMTAGGAFTLKHATIQKLPIILNENIQIFVDLVDQILILKSENKETTNLEQQIDKLIYKLYELTYDEVLIVEPEFVERVSREEYKKFSIE